MSYDLTDDKSTLAQVMACCKQITSHCLNQCWPRSLTKISDTIRRHYATICSLIKWACFPEMYSFLMSLTIKVSFLYEYFSHHCGYWPTVATVLCDHNYISSCLPVKMAIVISRNFEFNPSHIGRVRTGYKLGCQWACRCPKHITVIGYKQTQWWLTFIIQTSLFRMSPASNDFSQASVDQTHDVIQNGWRYFTKSRGTSMWSHRRLRHPDLIPRRVSWSQLCTTVTFGSPVEFFADTHHEVSRHPVGHFGWRHLITERFTNHRKCQGAMEENMLNVSVGIVPANIAPLFFSASAETAMIMVREKVARYLRY